MANQLGICDMDNPLVLEKVFSVNDLKEEECRDGDYADNKIQIFESAIIDNVKLQDNSKCDIMKCHIPTTLDNIKTELSIPEVQYSVIQDNLKIEEGIITDNIKTEFNNRLLYCEDCQAYREDYCAECLMLVHIMNKTVPNAVHDRPREELPHNILEIRDYSGQFRIFALKVIPVGVRFGPFIGMNTTERPWKIKGGKFVVNKDKSKYLNWMKYINPARNISEQNLQVFQYEHNLYYESTRQVQVGDELLVYFGEEYENSFNRNIEMVFVPTEEHIFKDAFACTFCCLGFSSKSCLAKHKTICPENSAGGFSIEELMQCPSCKIYLDQDEYFVHHMVYCRERNDTTKYSPLDVNGRKTRSRPIYKCQLCKYKTKYKGDLKTHINLHYEVKMYKCGVCCRAFKTKETLRQHVENTPMCTGGKVDPEHTKTHLRAEHSRSQDEKTKRFKCALCEFRTKYKISLKKHMKVKHLREFKYKCDTCDYKTNFQTYLKTHIETKHLKAFKYKCDACEYRTNWKSSLRTHVETRHLNEFKYKCDTCDYKVNYKSSLRIHIERKHLKEFKHKCDACEYKTNCKTDLKGHIERRHLKAFKYKCDACDYKANWKSSLKTHIETRHLNEFKYKCDICDYKGNCKPSLRAHIERKHLKEFKYKCDVCDYKGNCKSDLKSHIGRKHQKEFKYKCDRCEYKTNWKSELKKHIERKHVKEFKYKCDTCDYKSNWKFVLKKHIETRHLKEFKYNCDMCEYKTNLKSGLKTHIDRTHLKEFKYKCDSCDYKANQKLQLKTHIETKHLNEFKYKCDTCAYKTNRKSNLQIHTDRIHLKEFNYKCDSCDYKGNCKSDLKSHMGRKHSSTKQVSSQD